MQRVATGRDAAAPEPDPGPMGELHAHVALIPMLRLGPYLSQDVAFGTDRETTEVGLRAKLTPPLLRRPWRAWTFLGFGYARSYRPSHEATEAQGGDGIVGGLEGTYIDASFGFGIGTKVRAPWVLFAELAGRVGLAFWGDMYDRSPCTCLRDPYPGHDSFAASLSVGVSLDP
jgi:hypothetical protein